ncbi:CGGC domain-containing protein [Tissierella creatinini]|nr:CGGC domain-containing protein [Tissierella creatinini]TJX63827.1 CGGC domain-containing protein [Soehngenia saccharolytica]
MKRIGIYVCGNVSKKCTANGCMKAFNENADSFKIYDESDYKLVSFNSCNGCDEAPLESLLIKIEKFKKANVDVIHMSSCIRSKCDYYQEFVDELAKDFDVIGYTHGSEEGKKNNNINKKKIGLAEK